MSKDLVSILPKTLPAADVSMNMLLRKLPEGTEIEVELRHRPHSRIYYFIAVLQDTILVSSFRNNKDRVKVIRLDAIDTLEVLNDA